MDGLFQELRFALQEIGISVGQKADALSLAAILNPWRLSLVDLELESKQSMRGCMAGILERLEPFLADTQEKNPSCPLAHSHLLASRLSQMLQQYQRAWEHLEAALKSTHLDLIQLLEGNASADPFVREALISFAALPLTLIKTKTSHENENSLTFHIQQQLLEVNKRLHSELDPAQLFATIMDTVIEITGAERGLLLLEDEKDPDELRAVAARNFSKEDLQNPLFQISRSVCREVMERGKHILVKNAQADRKLSVFDSVSNLHLQSVLCFPFKLRGKTAGAIYLDNSSEQGAFTEEDLQTLAVFAEQAAIAMENARLHTESQNKYQELQERLRKIEHLNQRLEKELAAQTIELEDVHHMLQESRESLHLKFNYDQIIGGVSPKMKKLYKVLDRITSSNATVHIFGESGTGKELVARAIHYNGPRAKGNFISINCSAIPDELMESELFGHERGAFTSAVATRRGLFETASGGTLFFDEVGDMSPDMQVKLLRVLEEGKLRRLGGSDQVSVDVRVISASNKNIQEMVAEKKFRQDLFFRLNVIMITLPPLRERIEDLELLAKHILLELASVRQDAPKKITRAALNHLERYLWPGNVRELRNVLERSVVLVEGPEIDYADLPEEIILQPKLKQEKASPAEFGELLAMPYDDAMATFERSKIEDALRFCKGNVLRASNYLGMQRSTFRRKIEDYQIDPKVFRA